METYFRVGNKEYGITTSNLYINFEAINGELHDSWSIDILAEGKNSVNYSGMHSYLEFKTPREISDKSYTASDGFELAVQYVFLEGVGIIRMTQFQFEFGKWDNNLLKIPLNLEGKNEKYSFQLKCELNFTGYLFYNYTDEMINKKIKELDITDFDRTEEILKKKTSLLLTALLNQL